jgi:16S rRNA (uracil1498-N3)-methyltransferase
MTGNLRVYVGGLREGDIDLDPDASRYVTRVHRLRAGDAFTAFDPRARLEAPGVILACSRGRSRVRIGPPTGAGNVSRTDVRLVQALGKGHKPDQVVRDATALGVRELVLVESSRTVVRLGARGPDRRARWEGIAIEAARQSGRGDLPRIEGPVALEAALETGRGLRLVLDAAGSIPFDVALEGWVPTDRITILVGPEGGFGAREIDLALAHSFVAVRLGPFVLRTETAATAALGALVGRLRA